MQKICQHFFSHIFLDGIRADCYVHTMPKYINVRYSLTADEHKQLQHIQEHYEKKLRVSKLSQADVLRHMMHDIEATIQASIDIKKLAAR